MTPVVPVMMMGFALATCAAQHPAVSGGRGAISFTALEAPRQPNMAMLNILLAIEARQKNRAFSSGHRTIEIIREGRAGGMYGDSSSN